jgi:hypothetical protein
MQQCKGHGYGLVRSTGRAGRKSLQTRLQVYNEHHLLILGPYRRWQRTAVSGREGGPESNAGRRASALADKSSHLHCAGAAVVTFR